MTSRSAGSQRGAGHAAGAAAALWSFAYFFALLAGYYVLRPLRDQMGIAGGIKALPWLFTATFVTLLVAQPLYGALVARLPRARFIPIVYHFFVANLVAVLAAADLRASRRLPWRASSSFGSAYSTCLRSRCSGRSWPTSSPASRASACSGSSAPGARRVAARPGSHHRPFGAARSGEPADRGARLARTRGVLRPPARAHRQMRRQTARPNEQRIGGSAFAGASPR